MPAQQIRPSMWGQAVATAVAEAWTWAQSATSQREAKKVPGYWAAKSACVGTSEAPDAVALGEQVGGKGAADAGAGAGEDEVHAGDFARVASLASRALSSTPSNDRHGEADQPSRR